MHLLIPYVQLSHPDPDFDEFTYGDGGQRARKLKSDLNKGDYVFFHTSQHNKKYITAYYVVDRVLDTVDACRDRAIRAKYKNPHIVEYLARKRPIHSDEDAIVFGDPITSRALTKQWKPLLFDRKLADRLSLKIRFPANKSETQVIGSATRAWRELTNRDVRILLNAISAEQKLVQSYSLRSSEEVAETLERDIEHHIAHHPASISKGLKLSKQQSSIGEGRLDLLLEGKRGNLVVVEVKLGHIGRDALKQTKTYIRDLRKTTDKDVSGVIVCAGIMPAYEDELRKQKDIRILVFGWDLQIRPRHRY